MTTVPRLFVSYSHDDEAHKSWVLRLSDRLHRNGVEVLLDRWDLRLGGDLPGFMATGLTNADRVLAICTSTYVEKANSGAGGVGYEAMILTGQLMRNVRSDRIIPVVRNNSEGVLPVFLSTKLYCDFRDDTRFEASYTELLREIHGAQIIARPPLGPNPFAVELPMVEPKLSFSDARYVSPAPKGTVTFDYSNNNGRYVVGSGDMLFETAWSSSDRTSIIAYNDPPSIRSIALANGVANVSEISDARVYDTSSRSRRPRVGEIVVWQNTSGYYLATRIENVGARSHGSAADELTFTYAIAVDRSASFIFSA